MFEAENKQLINLININEDACEFYKDAQERAESLRIKDSFSDLEQMHKSVLLNLKDHVRMNGEVPQEHETLTGKAAQFWTHLVASVSNDVDETLVTHLEEAEDRCIKSMQEVMNSDSVRPSTKVLLQKEANALRRSHDYMKALKESMQAA